MAREGTGPALTAAWTYLSAAEDLDRTLTDRRSALPTAGPWRQGVAGPLRQGAGEHSREGLFGRLCGTPEIDRLVERGRSEMAPSARHSIYRQVEEAIARDALLLPLFHEQAYRFARPEVEGLTVSLWGQTVTYEELRIRG